MDKPGQDSSDARRNPARLRRPSPAAHRRPRRSAAQRGLDEVDDLTAGMTHDVTDARLVQSFADELPYGADAARIRATVKHLTYVKVDSFHDVHLSKPKAFIGVVDGFLKSLQ